MSANKTRQPNPRGRKQQHRGRHLSVRSELRKEPDLHKIARAVIALAMAQAEHDAAEEAAAQATIASEDDGTEDRARA